AGVPLRRADRDRSGSGRARRDAIRPANREHYRAVAEGHVGEYRRAPRGGNPATQAFAAGDRRAGGGPGRPGCLPRPALGSIFVPFSVEILEGACMTDRTCWESVKAEGGAVLDKLKEIVREGNVRRVRVRQGQRTIAEFPLTAGVVGAVCG